MLNEGNTERHGQDRSGTPPAPNTHVTTSTRNADVRAAVAIARRLGAALTQVVPAEDAAANNSFRHRASGWVSHHRSKGGYGEVIKQISRKGPRQAKQFAQGALSRSRHKRSVLTPKPTFVEPPTSAVWHILVGVSPTEGPIPQPSTSNNAARPATGGVIQVAIGPRFWWGEPWQPALAHRNIQMLTVSATVFDHGNPRGHLVRWLTAATDDTAASIAARFSAVAAELCAELVLSNPPLSPGGIHDDSPLSERIVARDNTTFDSAVWTDLVNSVTSF